VTARHASCSPRSLVFRPTSIWTRGLTFWEPTPALAADSPTASLDTMTDSGDTLDDSRDTVAGSPLHARSQFRSRTNPRRFALYSLAERPASGAMLVRLGGDDHSLMVVREFRRVPLLASSLSLALFTARAGHAAPAVAAVAHFVERAVSAWEPAYLMLARSLEQPRLSVLLVGVHQSSALEGGGSTSFSLDPLMPDLGPMLSTEPEIFDYCREEQPAEVAALVSPRAV
jgi:hypothetical protein